MDGGRFVNENLKYTKVNFDVLPILTSGDNLLISGITIVIKYLKLIVRGPVGETLPPPREFRSLCFSESVVSREYFATCLPKI